MAEWVNKIQGQLFKWLPFLISSKMDITNSPDITTFLTKVTWDISGVLPVIGLVNLSSGDDLASCTWWFVATSPSGTYIHEGSADSPDITGTWTDYTLSDNWPRPFNQIEWSGAPYIVTAYVEDSIGNIYSAEYTASICRPTGNTQSSKTPYGIGNVDVRLQCQQARIYFQDQTPHQYKGLEGTQVASVLRVIYPIDPTYTIPTPFQISSFSTALVPITYASDNYQFVFYTIYDYDFGNYSHIRIKYQQIETFPVLCNIDLEPLVCEYHKYINQVETGNCGDVAEANRILMLLNSKMALVMIGMQQPLTGINVLALIEEMQLIGGFTCDCCNPPTGIIPQTASIVDGYTFEIVPIGGDIDGEVVTNGYNIQFQLWDKSYVFTICSNSPQGTTAFSVSNYTSGDGYTKTYCLNIDMNQFGQDLATTISNDAYLYNLWNSIFNNSNTNFNLVVDGGCIFSSTSTCDYDFTLNNIPVNTTYALLSSIKIGNISQSLSFSFNLTNLPALSTYLNALGYGTFNVSNPSGQIVLISSSTNSNDIVALTYKISSTVYLADLSKSCTGYVPISADEVVQNIIYYLCGLTDEQVVTSQDYEICYLDSTGTKQTVTVSAESTLAALLLAKFQYDCTTIDYIQNVSGVTCDGMKTVFGVNNLSITSTDYLFGTKGGGTCSRINYEDAFIYMINSMTSTTRELFCNNVTNCGAGLSCAPYNYFEVIVSNYDTTCAPIMGLEITLT